MFKKTKRSVQVSFVKTPQTDDTTPGENKFFHPDNVKLIAERSKEVVKVVALTAVGVYAAVKTIDTLSQIAVKKTKSADNEKE
jgi:hypothetical protein